MRTDFLVILVLSGLLGLCHGINEDVETEKETGKEKVKEKESSSSSYSYRADSTWLDLTFGVPMNITFYEVIPADEKDKEEKEEEEEKSVEERGKICLLYTSPSPRDS